MEEVWLFLAALLAGYIDSQVGGGGVITLPALLAAGLPPHLALGTNKLAATGASVTASIQYLRHGLLDHRMWFAPLALLASVAGALVVLRTPPQDLRILVLVALAAVTIFVLLRPRFGTQARPLHRWAPFLLALAAVGIGFYDGFLGPGTGSFLLVAIIASQGLTFVRAAALGRVLNMASNIGALAVFAAAEMVDLRLGLVLAAGTIIGGYFGSRTTIRLGDRYVRALFIAVAAALLLRLALDA